MIEAALKAKYFDEISVGYAGSVMITGHEIHEYLGIGSKPDSFGVYTGFEIDGHRAPTKVGRSKNAQAIQRGQ